MWASFEVPRLLSFLRCYGHFLSLGVAIVLSSLKTSCVVVLNWWSRCCTPVAAASLNSHLDVAKCLPSIFFCLFLSLLAYLILMLVCLSFALLFRTSLSFPGSGKTASKEKLPYGNSFFITSYNWHIFNQVKNVIFWKIQIQIILCWHFVTFGIFLFVCFFFLFVQ